MYACLGASMCLFFCLSSCISGWSVGLHGWHVSPMQVCWVTRCLASGAGKVGLASWLVRVSGWRVAGLAGQTAG